MKKEKLESLKERQSDGIGEIWLEKADADI